MLKEKKNIKIFRLIIRYIVKNKLISLRTFSLINILDFTNLLLIKKNVIIYLVSYKCKNSIYICIFAVYFK